MVQVVALKLDAAKMFYSECKELHDPDITWALFKKPLQETF
jgi:hypothetical protein